MPSRSIHLRKAITISLIFHGGLFFLLICVVFSAKSPNLPQPAPLPKGVAGDALQIEGEGDGMVFIAPRQKWPIQSRFDTPDIVPTASQIKPLLDANVVPAVALQRRDALSHLMPARKLPDLSALPLEIGSGGSGGNGGHGVGGNTSGTGSSATFFAVPTSAKYVVFVLDGSASMGQTQAWHIARTELLAAIEHMAPEARCKVVIYAGTPRLLLPSRNDWLDPCVDRNAMFAAIHELEPEGRTEHGAALKLAIALQPEAIYFLTDADDLTQDHLRDIHLLNRERIPIHTIELTQRHRGRIGMPMQVLARRWNGVYQAIDVATWRPRR